MTENSAVASPLGRFLSLTGWLALAFSAAAIGAIASANAGSFYQQLTRPSWAPPSSLFGPVWTVLYLMMGIAAWLVWSERERKPTRTAITLFVVQLAFNTLWSWIFFAWREGGWAFAEILLLWVLIVATVVAFWRVRRLAAALMVPYLLWVTFAAALNFAIWRLNPQIIG